MLNNAMQRSFHSDGVSQGVTISTIVPSFHSQLLVFGLVCFVLDFFFFFFFSCWQPVEVKQWWRSNGGGERESDFKRF